MYCSKCGTECQGNAQFCANCGTPIKSQNNTSEAVQSLLKGGGGVKSKSRDNTAEEKSYVNNKPIIAAEKIVDPKTKPQKKPGCAQIGGGCLVMFIVLFVLFSMLLKSCNNHVSQKRPAGTAVTKPLSKIDKSADMQARRKQLIKELISKGVFAKVEVPGTSPRVWVTPVFYTLEFKTKENFISVVYSYYYGGNDYGDNVRIFDNMSGKEVGDYSLANPGLSLK
jgi:hypothetical protein